eukprot:Anaeramoba_ignava/c21296_g1_i1.p1 GENE.c21296_g1_i1~~c21296_g1_i1.p1  ORF type:complete len:1248 (-),score=467.24 c21296_g1_i1:38-3760(-)
MSFEIPTIQKFLEQIKDFNSASKIKTITTLAVKVKSTEKTEELTKFDNLLIELYKRKSEEKKLAVFGAFHAKRKDLLVQFLKDEESISFSSKILLSKMIVSVLDPNSEEDMKKLKELIFNLPTKLRNILLKKVQTKGFKKFVNENFEEILNRFGESSSRQLIGLLDKDKFNKFFPQFYPFFKENGKFAIIQSIKINPDIIVSFLTEKLAIAPALQLPQLWQEYQLIFKQLMNTNPEKFIDLLSKYSPVEEIPSFVTPRLKTLFKVNNEKMIEVFMRPEYLEKQRKSWRYQSTIITKRKINKKLSKDDLSKICQFFKESELRKILANLPPSERFAAYEDAYKEEPDDQIRNEYILLLLPIEHRINEAKKMLKIPAINQDEEKKRNFEKLLDIKEQRAVYEKEIKEAASAEERGIFYSYYLICSSLSKNAEEIEKTLKFIVPRTKNEQEPVRNQIVNALKSHAIKYLNESHIELLKEFLKNAMDSRDASDSLNVLIDLFVNLIEFNYKKSKTHKLLKPDEKESYDDAFAKIPFIKFCLDSLKKLYIAQSYISYLTKKLTSFEVIFRAAFNFFNSGSTEAQRSFFSFCRWYPHHRWSPWMQEQIDKFLENLYKKEDLNNDTFETSIRFYLFNRKYKFQRIESLLEKDTSLLNKTGFLKELLLHRQDLCDKYEIFENIPLDQRKIPIKGKIDISSLKQESVLLNVIEIISESKKIARRISIENQHKLFDFIKKALVEIGEEKDNENDDNDNDSDSDDSDDNDDDDKEKKDEVNYKYTKDQKREFIKAISNLDILKPSDAKELMDILKDQELIFQDLLANMINLDNYEGLLDLYVPYVNTDYAKIVMFSFLKIGTLSSTKEIQKVVNDVLKIKDLKVTVRKEIYRLLGFYKFPETKELLFNEYSKELHPHAKIALLNMLRSKFLDEPKTWEILDKEIQSKDNNMYEMIIAQKYTKIPIKYLLKYVTLFEQIIKFTTKASVLKSVFTQLRNWIRPESMETTQKVIEICENTILNMESKTEWVLAFDVLLYAAQCFESSALSLKKFILKLLNLDFSKDLEIITKDKDMPLYQRVDDCLNKISNIPHQNLNFLESANFFTEVSSFILDKKLYPFFVFSGQFKFATLEIDVEKFTKIFSQVENDFKQYPFFLDKIINWVAKQYFYNRLLPGMESISVDIIKKLFEMGKDNRNFKIAAANILKVIGPKTKWIDSAIEILAQMRKDSDLEISSISSSILLFNETSQSRNFW